MPLLALMLIVSYDASTYSNLHGNTDSIRRHHKNSSASEQELEKVDFTTLRPSFSKNI